MGTLLRTWARGLSCRYVFKVGKMNLSKVDMLLILLPGLNAAHAQTANDVSVFSFSGVIDGNDVTFNITYVL